MKIGLDIRPFLSGETGVGVYFKNLLHAMSELDSEHFFYLLSSSFREKFPQRSLPDFRNKKFIDLKIPVSLLNLLWFKFRFPPMGLFFMEKLDLTHSPNPLITPGGKKKIITIHDLSFIDAPDLAMKEAVTYFSPLIKRSVNRADGIISVSQFTKSKIGDIFGKETEDKTQVIYHGSDLDLFEEKEPGFEIPERFFLFTGTLEPRKNLAALIRGFALAKEKAIDVKLILSGGYGAQFGEITRLISILRLDNDVILPGYLKRKSLNIYIAVHSPWFSLPIMKDSGCLSWKPLPAGHRHWFQISKFSGRYSMITRSILTKTILKVSRMQWKG